MPGGGRRRGLNSSGRRCPRRARHGFAPAGECYNIGQVSGLSRTRFRDCILHVIGRRNNHGGRLQQSGAATSTQEALKGIVPQFMGGGNRGSEGGTFGTGTGHNYGGGSSIAVISWSILSARTPSSEPAAPRVVVGPGADRPRTVRPSCVISRSAVPCQSFRTDHS
jgi:hypothetical protein